MTTNTFRDYGNGIYAIDAGYVRHLLAAIHLIVDHGRVAVIDTGTHASLGRVTATLTALGLDPAAVDYIVLTHIHLDHAGGAGTMMREFPQARLVVHPRGARHMIDPGKLMRATEDVYGKEQARALYGELVPVPSARVIEADDELLLQLGERELVCYDSPGHAKHHVFIHDRVANGIFSGDAFGISYRELDVDDRAFVFPTTSPAQFDPIAMRNSIERMVALEPESMYLAHYSRIRPPRGLADDVLRRMDAFVGMATRAIEECPEAPVPAIHEAMESYLLSEAHKHGISLSDREILEICQLDIKLNAEGAAIWARQAK